MASGAKGARPQSGEFTSLAERMGSMQALRVGMACLVLSAGLLVPDVIGASLADLILVTAGYLFVTAIAEGLRRMERRGGLTILTTSIFIDGIYIAWIMYETGGARSPLRFLMYVHVIAVMLLASYRTGLKVTVWDGLLMLVVYYAQAAGVLDVREGLAGALPGQGPLFTQVVLFNVTALLVIALVTARFSALNERELKRRKADMEDLAAMGAELENRREPSEVAEVLLDSIISSFGFKRGVVLVGDEHDMRLTTFHAPGEPPSIRPGVDEVVAAAISSHTPQLKKQLDPETDPRLAALLPFARNIAIFPLVAEGETLGAVALEYPARAGIERRVVDMVRQFVFHAALTLQNAQLYQQVQKQAETDALTGIANRRTFEVAAEKELSRAGRNGEQVTLAIFDIDHFKALNDNYGHQTGDEVLKKVAKALADTCRDFDTPARYGGEEFVVVLPSCSSKESLMVAERLRRSISEIETVTDVSASAGVATFPTHASDLQGLVKAADEALYESKRAGRDRVTRSRRRGRVKQQAPVDTD